MRPAREVACSFTGCDKEEPRSTHWPECDRLTQVIEARDIEVRRDENERSACAIRSLAHPPGGAK